MARLKLIEGKNRKRVLVYGMQLFEPGTLATVSRGEIVMADGQRSRLTFHIIEGSPRQIKKQLATSIDAFFDLQDEMKT
ncbi:MAG: allantoinase [Candidatus Binatia bacterium]